MEVGGRKKVKSFKEEFRKEFGVGIRVYKGQHFADDEATLASIRKDNARKFADFDIFPTATVGNIESYFLNKLGIKIQIEASNGSLAKNDRTLAQLKQ
jgi:hypothetical protein